MAAPIPTGEQPAMRYLVEIATDNDAFYPEPGPELARILRKLAERIETAAPDELTAPVRLMDYNGNTVGSAVLSED